MNPVSIQVSKENEGSNPLQTRVSPYILIKVEVLQLFSS